MFRVRGGNFIGTGFPSEPVSPLPPDTDNDGMPDAFEASIPGLNANNAADAALDLDSDGATNLEEYLAGTVPNNAASVFTVDSLTLLPSGNVEVRFAAQPNKAYSLLVSSSLQPGSWQKLTDIAATPALRPEVVITDTTTSPGGFRGYRVVTPPVP